MLLTNESELAPSLLTQHCMKSRLFDTKLRSNMEQTQQRSSSASASEVQACFCEWVKGSSFVSCGTHSASSLFTPPPHDLYIPVFIYAAPHAHSHLPLHDNDGKQEGQWQLLVLLKYVSVILHFDGEVFAKAKRLCKDGKCVYQKHLGCSNNGSQGAWRTHRKGLFYVPFYLFSSPSQQQIFHQISALFVCLVRKSELSKQRQETAEQVVRRGWTSAPQTGRTAQGLASSKTQASPNRSYNLFSTLSFQFDSVPMLISGPSEVPCWGKRLQHQELHQTVETLSTVPTGQQWRKKKWCGWRQIGARSILQKHDPVSVFLQSAEVLRCGQQRGMQEFVLDSSSRGQSSLLKNNTFPSLCAADNRDQGPMFGKAEHTRPRTQ